MQQIYLVKYGEIILKGLNRKYFENRLIKNIKGSLSKLGKFEVTKEQAVIYVRSLEEVSNRKVIEKLKKIFGIVNFSVVYEVNKNMDDIKGEIVKLLEDKLNNAETFKVETKRSDKSFPLKSPEVSRDLGACILKSLPNLKVDVHNPDILINVEIRKSGAFIYTEKIKCAGGLPVGVSGKGCLLLSGGIDSPAAGWMMSKRGLELEAVHFFSFPYTSERAKEKVIDLAKIISDYCGRIRLHVVPFTDIQLEIQDKCPEDQLTLIMRRFMMKIAEAIAKKNNCECLITGESLGQVASQTILSLGVTNSAVEMPVFRPLVGMDKEEIVSISKDIGTFETSILPYEDCCTIFIPKHPNTRPKINKIIESEKLLNVDKLIDEAVDSTEEIIIN